MDALIKKLPEQPSTPEPDTSVTPPKQEPVDVKPEPPAEPKKAEPKKPKPKEPEKSVEQKITQPTQPKEEPKSGGGWGVISEETKKLQ